MLFGGRKRNHQRVRKAVSCFLPKDHGTWNHLTWGQEWRGPVALQRLDQRLMVSSHSEGFWWGVDGWHVPNGPSSPCPVGCCGRVGGSMTRHSLPAPAQPCFQATNHHWWDPWSDPAISWLYSVSGWGIQASKKINCSSSNNIKLLLY